MMIKNSVCNNLGTKNRMILCFVLTMLISASTYASTDSGTITVYCGNNKAHVNRKIFGSNLLAYDPSTMEDWTKVYYAGHADYGDGIWDSKWNEPVDEAIRLARGAGVSILRFPGGCGSHHYKWKDAIGKGRKEFLYGIDEFLKTCERTGAVPVYTISYFAGDERDAADLVEYLNSPNDGTNSNGGVDWASERAKNGHPAPYNVKYFEIGNEIEHGDHRKIKQVFSNEYARTFLKYYDCMKSVDSSISVGAVLTAPGWNRGVLEILKEKIDFGIIHAYPTPAWGFDIANFKIKEIFYISLALPMLETSAILSKTVNLLKETTNRWIPLAITEYNAGFSENTPVPYRHSLIASLVVAELLRIFMEPENNILMANYWQFINDWWGMTANGFNGKYESFHKPYYNRPSYYVFEMYHEHFGDEVIEANITCDTYDLVKYISIDEMIAKTERGTTDGNNMIEGRWTILPFDGADASLADGIVNINFIEPKQFNYFHATQVARIASSTYYRLSGYIKTDALIDNEGVCLEVLDGRGWVVTHSGAATFRVTGTTDWQYVDVIYKTLPDAKTVTVIARRIGDNGPLKGRAYFKDVKLEKFIPIIDTKIPYLSVNASKSADGDKVYLMVINKNMDESEAVTIELRDFVPSGEINAWILNGPSVDATNEVTHDNVKITNKKVKINGNPFEFVFEPHSFTAIEIEGGVANAEFSKKTQ